MTAISRATDNLRRVLVDAVERAAGHAGEGDLRAALAGDGVSTPAGRSGRLRRAWLYLRLSWHLGPTAVAALDRAAQVAAESGARHVGREHLAAALER